MVPPRPSFDYYAELDVGHTATKQEILSAYNRLVVLLSHPDRNRDNPDDGTEMFQRVQQAYKTLSDDASRNYYDTLENFYSSARSGNFRDSDDRFDDSDGESQQGHRCKCGRVHDEEDDDPGYEFISLRDLRRNRRLQQLEKEEEARLAALKSERQARSEADIERRKAKEEARKVAEEESGRVKDQRREEERQRQEERWARLGLVSKDDKLKVCLHSDFCTKVTQRKKFKCYACQKKRGLTAFECPYCSSFLCQQCISKFSARRIKEETITDNSPRSLHEEDVEDVNEERIEHHSDQKQHNDEISGEDEVIQIKKSHEKGKSERRISAPGSDCAPSGSGLSPQQPKNPPRHKRGDYNERGRFSHPNPYDIYNTINSDDDTPSPTSSEGDQSNHTRSTTPPDKPGPNGSAGSATSPGSPTGARFSRGGGNGDIHNRADGHYQHQNHLSLAGPRCYDCGGFGHFARDCRAPKQCQNCGEAGHVSRFCAKRFSRINPQRAAPIGPVAAVVAPFSPIAITPSPPVAPRAFIPRHLPHPAAARHESVRGSTVNGGVSRISDSNSNGNNNTRVLIRGATLARGITEPLLREAMTAFGTVTECTIDRRVGIAWADFSDPSIVAAVIAASPVPVAQGQVKIFEWPSGSYPSYR